ncbi:MAG: zinc-ribbon domain-containing protein [Bacillota bacterium]|nr:zinc-ribbon domain-containing protein [Bacillota bacterium]
MSAGRKIKTSIYESWSLMEEWDTEKNTLNPRTISPGSDRAVWWKCSKGHSYEMQVNLKAVRNYGCPICSGHRVEAGFNDFASAYPDLLKFWDFERNDIRPDEVTKESNKKVWWTCPQGHSYEMTVHKKVSRNAGCPVCSGHKTVKGVNDFATLYPELAKEWHPEKNGDLKPTDVSKKNGKKVWWQCRYGHEWLASVHDRADGTGCPFCAEGRLTSFPEQAIFYYIKNYIPMR